MIIKKSEFDELKKIKDDEYNRIRELYSDAISLNSKLNIEINELKESIKQDAIEVNIFARKCSSNGFWIYDNVQLEKTNVDLSHGIKGQILGMFRNVISKLSKQFDGLEKLHNLQMQNVINKNLKFKTEILKFPLFISRSRILKLYDEIYYNENCKRNF